MSSVLGLSAKNNSFNSLENLLAQLDQNRSSEKASNNTVIKKDSTANDNPSIVDNIKFLFSQNSDQLISDLISHPEHKKTYFQLNQCLKKMDKQNFVEWQSIIYSIQKIADLLRSGQMKVLDTFIKETNGANISYATLANFLNLNSDENISKVRAIPNEEIRFRVMAQIIDRDKIPLTKLQLSGAELNSLAKHLTYVDLSVRQDGSFNYLDEEVEAFLKAVPSENKIQTLIINSRNIRNLPSLPNCHTLDCSNCNKLYYLPPLPNCHALNCSNCQYITQLKDLPNCVTVDCSMCEDLVQLDLPNCQTFNCSFCSNLQGLPVMPNCQTINCHKCERLTWVPHQLNCLTFICSETSLDMLPPGLPKCKMLDCSNCPYLKEWTPLPDCTELNCSKCPKWEQLPNLPNCQRLICFDCTSLRLLETLPNCEYINCKGCLNIEYIGEQPNCRVLECANCPRLPELHNLPNCVRLDCTNCAQLQRLPELSNCNELIFEGCSRLNLNSIPPRFRPRPRVDLPQALRGNVMQIRWQDLQDNPFGVLLSLENSLIHSGAIPRIQFLEQDGRQTVGIDAGGVYRVFISSLMQSLISHSEQPKQLKFLKTDAGLHLPLLDPSIDMNKQIKGFQILGAIFKHCYESALNPARNEGVTTGICFDRKLFDIITNLTSQELNQINPNNPKLPDEVKLKLLSLFSEPLTQKQLTLLRITPKNMTLEQFNTLKATALQHIILGEDEKLPPGMDKEKPNPDEMEKLISWLQASLKEALLIRMDVVNYWLPAVVIAKQIHTQIGTVEGWHMFSHQGATKINLDIQGLINKDSLLSDASDSTIEWVTGNNLDAEKVENTKKYVKQWIKEAEPKDLERFSNFITGSPTLSPSKKIRFQLYDEDNLNKLPNTHSCSFQIDLSINYPSYQHFKDKLERALEETSSLETSGLEAF